jgi:hypothetical protein
MLKKTLNLVLYEKVVRDQKKQQKENSKRASSEALADLSSGELNPGLPRIVKPCSFDKRKY